MVQIEKGVPFSNTSGPHPNTKYPFRAMEVDDSFVVADRTPHTMRAVARHHAERTGFTFKVRAEGNGSRIWRTA